MFFFASLYAQVSIRLSAQDAGLYLLVFFVLAGAGIGVLLGPASTDAVNRAINASWGEVTGITQTMRNYAASLGIAVLGTVFGTVFANRLADVGASRKGVIDSYAIGTRGVLIGMAVALGLSFVVALAHPGDRVSGEPDVR